MAMNQYPVKGLQVDVCPECSGVWFDGDELKRITLVFGYGQWPELFERWKKEHVIFDHRGDLHTEPGRECPRDYTAMQKHYFAGDSDIGVDNCPTCDGFWVDGGELSAIWEYVRPDTNKDVLASGLVELVTYEQKKNDEMENKQNEIAEGMVTAASLATNPLQAGAVAVSFIVRLILKELINEQSRRV